MKNDNALSNIFLTKHVSDFISLDWIIDIKYESNTLFSHVFNKAALLLKFRAIASKAYSVGRTLGRRSDFLLGKSK